MKTKANSVKKLSPQFLLAASLALILTPSPLACLGPVLPIHHPQSEAASASHDFDFLIGNWLVHHRRLKHRLAHSDEWESFSGTCEMRLLLGGAANVDDNVLNTPEGMYRASSLRAFDPASQKWSIWWLDARHPGQLDPPVVGQFRNRTGTFLADDSLNGKPIKVRYLWSNITPNSARWEQAFSPDGGATWETNWIMDFTRAPR